MTREGQNINVGSSRAAREEAVSVPTIGSLDKVLHRDDPKTRNPLNALRTVKELVALAGKCAISGRNNVSDKSIRAAVHSGELPSIRLHSGCNAKILVAENDFWTWLQSLIGKWPRVHSPEATKIANASNVYRAPSKGVRQ